MATRTIHPPIKIGDTFDRWTVLRPAEPTKNGHPRVCCQCVCGTIRDVSESSLRRGISRSCGCLKDELTKQRSTTHGKAGGIRTPEYKCWKWIRTRLYNPHDAGYKNYGGRGIQMCQGWQDFRNFLADMKEKPSPQYSIDRKDNEGHYSCGHCAECLTQGWPANCIWATRAMQNSHKRNSHLLTYNGETKNMTQWADSLKHLGFSYDLIRNRINRYGWSVERTLTTPPCIPTMPRGD